MRSWGGILIGAVGLAVLDAVVSRTQSADNVGGFLAGLGSAVQRFVSPSVPAFSTTSTPSSSSSQGQATTPSGAAVEAGATETFAQSVTALGGGVPVGI